MKIVLATGIFPPAVGGPATYVEQLSKELVRRGEDVIVITYASNATSAIEADEEGGKRVVRVAKGRLPYLRWRRYAKALKDHADDADVVVAFSPVSVGMPLKMAKLKKPRRVLRIGGDFFWERYTGMHGRRTLREWYRARPFTGKPVWLDDAAYALTQRLNAWLMKPLLRKFHQLIFTTHFEENIYRLHYPDLPPHAVIENAFPANALPQESVHVGRAEELSGRQMRLLFFGRFVGFKNLPSLLRAVALLPHVKLSLVGEGPQTANLKSLAQQLGIVDRVNFSAPKTLTERHAVFNDHDLIIIPSLTEISPNSALEARAAGMPVLLTEETGLSENLTRGMVLRPLREPEEIVRAVLEVEQNYADIAKEAMQPIPERASEQVAQEWVELFKKIVS